MRSIHSYEKSIQEIMLPDHPVSAAPPQSGRSEYEVTLDYGK